MQPSENCFKIIANFEGLRLAAYKDSGSVPTIGFGSTFYPDGSKVKMGDKITIERAEELLEFGINAFSKTVDAAVTAKINQNQFDSLVSLCYNIGAGAFVASTLLKKVNANPSDPLIRDQFNRWNKDNGSTLMTLVRRRKKEADLYFTPITSIPAQAIPQSE